MLLLLLLLLQRTSHEGCCQFQQAIETPCESQDYPHRFHMACNDAVQQLLLVEDIVCRHLHVRQRI
jgi:hypothetical protein